jgi:hypothetical protein
VNVYDDGLLVVCVVVAGDEVIEYDVAPGAAVHVRLTVFVVAPDTVRFVIAGGGIAEETYTFA